MNVIRFAILGNKKSNGKEALMYYQAIEFSDCYEKQSIKENIFNMLDALKIADELYEGINVLIKPNLLSNTNPFFAVTTNPAVVEAVIDWLIEHGVKNIVIADSPGGALVKMPGFSYDKFYTDVGLISLKDKAVLNNDGSYVEVMAPQGCRNKNFNILKVIAQADYIINIPKLKTHNLTAVSLGIKNLFGCVPDIQKPAFHAKYPKIEDFSQMLLELALTVKPNLTVVDAVDIMEGNGPVHGKKRTLGMLFASKDLFSQDYFISEMLSVDCKKVSLFCQAENLGLIDKAEVISHSVKKDYTPEPILLPEFLRSDTLVKKLKAAFMINVRKITKIIIKQIPEVKDNKCCACNRCATSCPQKAIKIKNTAVIDLNTCISCFCCNEVCPTGAIIVKNRLFVNKKHK